TLASAGRDARARLWDATTGKRLRQIRGLDSQHKSVAFVNDGKALLVAGTDGELALWRTDSGQKLRDFGQANQAGRSIPFGAALAGRKTVLSIEQQQNRGREQISSVRFWDTESGQSVRSFPVQAGGFGQVTVALSPDGKTLATVILSGNFYQRS